VADVLLDERRELTARLFTILDVSNRASA
jgi:hypothetical protein